VPRVREQRRGRKIAMTKEELDAYLAASRTCSVATVSTDGPHVSALWFAWDGESLWLYSIIRSQRWTDVARDPRVAILVEAGEDYMELQGVEIRGTAAPVGEVPRTGEPNDSLGAPERIFATKYQGGEGTAMSHDGRHAWLRVTPEKISSWDFRKLAQLA
jgi:hypothetical protein